MGVRGSLFLIAGCLRMVRCHCTTNSQIVSFLFAPFDHLLSCLSPDLHERGLYYWVSRIASSPEELLFAWEDLCGVFDSLYVNWDPEVFKHQMSHHACVARLVL